MILVTSLVGSYVIIRGLSLFIGGFPSEVDIYFGVQAETSWTLYAYIIAMMLLFVIGAIF